MGWLLHLWPYAVHVQVVCTSCTSLERAPRIVINKPYSVRTGKILVTLSLTPQMVWLLYSFMVICGACTNACTLCTSFEHAPRIVINKNYYRYLDNSRNSLTHSVRTELFLPRGHRGEFPHRGHREDSLHTEVTWMILGTHSLTNSHPIHSSVLVSQPVKISNDFVRLL